jgi:septum formation inhibitor MinC
MQVPNDPVFELISGEFRKNGIKVYLDTMITKLLSKDEEDSDNKIQLIVKRIKEKAAQSGKVISILNLTNDEFVDFYNAVQNLKKLGYKFYTLTRFAEKEQERLDREKEKKEEELKKQPKETKKEVKKNVKPKQTKTSKKK